MNHPLENYRKIAEANFIFQVEEKFYSDCYAELSLGLYVDIERDKNRMRVTGVDISGNDFSEYVSFSSYFISNYNKLEVETRSIIDGIILSHLEESKQELFIRNIIAELQVLQIAISKSSLDSNHEVYKSILFDKVNLFSQMLNEIYLTPKNISTPKIQWLGKTNILATLFYDLWKGQDKGKQPSTKQLINANKKDLEALLINNFFDEKGKQLTENTISDYLNSSKPEKRAKKGVRIELNY